MGISQFEKVSRLATGLREAVPGRRSAIGTIKTARE
jgi:hypothetical protein